MTTMIRKIALLAGATGETEATGRPVDLNLNCVKEFTEEEFAEYVKARDALIIFDENRRL